MSVRIQRLGNAVPDPDPEVGSGNNDDLTLETTVDGQTYAWGPGQTRNFLDDGVGIAHGAFDGGVNAVTETGLEATNGDSRA